MNTVSLAWLIAASAGCGETAEPGTLTVTVYGEEFIEDGIPAAELSDGWAITFERFLLVVADVTAESGHDEGPALDDGQPRLYDLARSSGGMGYVVTSAEVPSGTYDHVAYRVAPAADAIAGNATAADLALMSDNGYAVYVEGSATRDQDTIAFAWGFPGATGYGACHTEAEVSRDAGDTVELTIHGDHLFYDDLVAPEPDLAFDLIASADTDADGAVTPAELAAVDIAGEERYQVGNFDEVTDLWGFISMQVTTLGHIDGEGHCDEITR